MGVVGHREAATEVVLLEAEEPPEEVLVLSKAVGEQALKEDNRGAEGLLKVVIKVAVGLTVEEAVVLREAEEIEGGASITEAVAGDVAARQWLATKRSKLLFFAQIKRQRLLLQDRKLPPVSRRLVLGGLLSLERSASP